MSRLLGRFRRDERGNFAAIFAVATVPILAAVAAAVDVVSTTNKADQLQQSLDTAAIAIAAKYYSGMSDSELETIGREFFMSNMIGTQPEEDSFDYEAGLFDDFGAKVTSDGPEDYVTVRSSVQHAGMLGSIDWNVHRQSVVRIKPGEPACVLALDPHASSSVKIHGSAEIDMLGCVIASNSDSTSAVYRGGSAKITAECVNTVGGTSGISGSSRATLECGAPRENQYESNDPLAGVTPPSYTGCQSVPGGKSKSLSPGTYCNEKFSGDISLEPGTYILRGGRVNLGGNGSLAGHGVTIFLMEDAEFTINGNEVVDLSPPASGPYAGITIYQEKSNDSTVKINGTSNSEISGFVYAPGAHVFFAGNATTTTGKKCLRLAGKTVEMTGNSGIKSDCEAELGGRSMFASRYMIVVR